jgi:RHS repeat-associated protein
VTDPLSHTTTSVYDELGRLASTTDANSHDTTYGYDLDGNQTTATAPDTGVTTTGYDPAGRKLTITDPLSHTTTNLYDTAGQLVKTTTPTGEVTSNGYDAVGNKVQVTDPSGHTTSYTYDPVNRQVTEKTPLGDTTTTAYDNVGNKTSVTDPLGHVTTYAYDAADRLTSTVVDPGSGHLNITSSTAYDAAGRVSSKTDPNSHTTSYGYDDADRQTSVTGPDGSNTALTYDANGNLLTRTDDNSHTTSYTYDDADQQTSKTDPLGHQWTYTYDPAGNKTEMVDGNGNATTGISTDGITGYSYDSVNRLTGIDYSDSTPDVAYAYDLAGNRTTMTDGAGTVAYTYDDSDRLTGVIRGTSGFAYTYDTAGRLSSRTYPDGTATSYSYDNDSRLATATNSSNTTGYTYDNASRLTATTYPNGWSEHRTYDAADRLSDIRSVKSGSTDLAVATYTRDAAGNPTTIVRDGVSEAYGYDSADRVTGACYGGALSTCASGSKITYAYDKVGNRSSQTKFGTTTTYTYDGGDELTGSTVGSTTTLYSFDDDGQQTGEGYKTYSYDLAGRLVQATDHSSVVATFTYDGSGNRLTKTASSVTTNYAWDENNDLPMLALEWQGSTVLRDYLYGDRLISMNSGGAAYYLHHDALNTTSAVTKSTAAIEWTYTYDPYGNTRTTTKVDPAAPTNPIQYTGELLDTETSLYDLRARIYNPTAGGFLSTDPVPQDPGGSGISAFLYANAAPLVLTDPAGQRPVSDDGPDGHPCFTSGWWFDSPSECPSPQTGTHGGDSDGSNSGSAAGANDDSHPSRTQTNAYDSRFTNGVLPGDRWGQDLVRQQLDPNEQRIQYAYEFFMSKGFTPEQAAALVGSLMVESYAWTESDAATNGAMRPDQLQRNSDGSVCYTDKGEYCGRGLASWSPDRWDDFERWAADANENGYGEKLAVNSFVAQLEFVSWELKNNRPLTYDYLKRQTTVLGAVKAIQCGLCKNNPNPAIEATGYLNAGIPHLDWRYCNARRVLHNFGPGTSLYGCPQHGQSGD